MNCTLSQESLSQWMDGELFAANEAELFAHLGKCETCRVFFRDLHLLKEEVALSRLLDVPKSLDTRVLGINPNARVPNRHFPWLQTERMYSFRSISLAVLLSIVVTASISAFWYRYSQSQQTIVCLTPLPEVEVTGYVVVGSPSTKGINQ